METKNILKRGAEAVIYFDFHEGKKIAVKERVKKSYRIPSLDISLRKIRTKKEANLLIKARRAGISVPEILSTSDLSLKMEYIEGRPLKDILSKANAEDMGRQTGAEVAKMHAVNIIHGDLTSSNIIWKRRVHLIDFGLAKASPRIEDKASDIFVFYETMNASQPSLFHSLWKGFLEGYKNEQKDAIMRQLAKIEMRRRYRQQAD